MQKVKKKKKKNKSKDGDRKKKDNNETINYKWMFEVWTFLESNGWLLHQVENGKCMNDLLRTWCWLFSLCFSNLTDIFCLTQVPDKKKQCCVYSIIILDSYRFIRNLVFYKFTKHKLVSLCHS